MTRYTLYKRKSDNDGWQSVAIIESTKPILKNGGKADTLYTIINQLGTKNRYESFHIIQFLANKVAIVLAISVDHQSYYKISPLINQLPVIKI